MADEITLRAYLRNAQVLHELIEIDGSTRTAREAAAALGAPLCAIVKSLECLSDGRPVVALVPGDQSLSLTKLSRELDSHTVTLAAGRIVRKATGYPVGGVAPLAHARQVPVYGDARILEHDQVYCGAGSVRHMLRIGTADLSHLAAVTWTDLSL